MPESPSSSLVRYAAAVLGPALATAVRLLLDPLLGDSYPFFTYFLAVAFVAWYGGLGPSLLALLLGVLSVDFFFLPPRGALAVPTPHDLTRLGLYVVLGSVTVLLSESLRAARRKAESHARRLAEVDRQKDVFLACLAHELRNPLAPIRHAAQLLQAAGADPVVAQARDVIDRQARQLSRLVDDLLDIGRLQQGKLRLRRQPVELAAVLGQAVETARPVIEAGSHGLEVALPDEPVWLQADPTRLAQVFGNLLVNAAKYTDPGGLIALAAERDGGEVVVRVRDRGVGMPPALVARAFDLFLQGDGADERARGGLGIGLALVKSLTELHGGRVEAHSDGPGRGSEFVVRLPVAGPAAA
jgi:signal transduction histidine kinase